jgi:hypothetical protein
LLLAAAVIMVANARIQTLIPDELMGYYTTVQPTVAAELHFQRTLPLVIEPPAYDLLVRAAWLAFGAGQLALRSISVFSILVLITALYQLLLLAAGYRAAVFGALMVVFFLLLNYGWQERPYSFVLATVAVAVLCWFCATREGLPRTTPLVGLCLSLALAVNSHYYCVFALAPFLVAEAVRTVKRGRLDLPMALSLLLACASTLLYLPFLHAGLQYKDHANNSGSSFVNWSQIVRTYEWTLNFHGVLSRTHHGFGLYALVLAGLAFLGSAWRLIPRGLGPFWTLLAALLLTPVLTVAASVLVLHSYSPRYTIYQSVALILGLGILVGPWLDRMSKPAFTAAAALFCLACGYHHYHYVQESRRDREHVLGLMAAPPQVAAILQRDPSAMIYAPVETCMYENYYGTALVRDRLRCITSADREMRFDNSRQISLISAALQSQPGFHIVTYEQMRAAPGTHLFVERQETWYKWIDRSLAEDHMVLTPLAKGLTGDVFLLQGPGS